MHTVKYKIKQKIAYTAWRLIRYQQCNLKSSGTEGLPTKAASNPQDWIMTNNK